MKFENLRKLGRDQRGLSTVEYTVLLVLIVGCTVALWNKLGNKVEGRIKGATEDFVTYTK